MEADELAGMLREWAEVAEDNLYCPHPELRSSETATAHEDTAFYLMLSDGERFLVSVSKVGE